MAIKTETKIISATCSAHDYQGPPCEGESAYGLAKIEFLKHLRFIPKNERDQHRVIFEIPSSTDQ